MSAKEYEDRANAIIGSMFPHGKAKLEWHSTKEAQLLKARITQMQKELRFLKKELAAVIRSINAQAINERAKIGKSFGSGVAAGLFGKKTVGSFNASMKNSISESQRKAREPYDRVKRQIDSVVLQLDETKLKLDQWLAAQAAEDSSGAAENEPTQQPTEPGLLSRLLGKK